MNLTPTASQTVGPYLHLGLTDKRSISRIAGDDVKGERVWLTFRVLDEDGLPVPDAMIELWQADSEGNYPRPDIGAGGGGFGGFGRLGTAEDGSCTFETIRPGAVPAAGETLQAPHINVSVFGRGILKRLSTRLYFAGDPANDADPALALVPDNRRPTLFARPDPGRPGTWIFEVRLRGERETVFFDV